MRIHHVHRVSGEWECLLVTFDGATRYHSATDALAAVGVDPDGCSGLGFAGDRPYFLEWRWT